MSDYDWGKAPLWANVLIQDTSDGSYAWATAYHKHATWEYCASHALHNGLDPLGSWVVVENRPQSVLSAKLDIGASPLPPTLAAACMIQPEMEACQGIDAVLAERGERYGDFTEHAELAQALQHVMRSSAGWFNLTCVQAQALTVIADKIARILNGDPNYADNWVDIQGYAKLVEERLDNKS
jgi:hypothetical protein